jgi:hypothetical protein
MPEVQAQIQLTFEVIDSTLEQLALVDTAQHSDLIEACATRLFGSKQAEVEALLNGTIGRPTIPVTTRGVPEVLDCWQRVLSAVDAYNEIGTGLQLDLASQDPEDMPPPHCAVWQWIDGVRVLVFNWSVAFTAGGRTAPLFPVSEEAEVDLQVLAMGHAAISVPIESAAP